MNKIKFFSGFKPIPTTFAPNLLSQKDNQLPLNPVDPVIMTFEFLNTFFAANLLQKKLYKLNIETKNAFVPANQQKTLIKK